MKQENKLHRPLYTLELDILSVIDFGVTQKNLAVEGYAHPKEGVRLDAKFRGLVTGPKISGTIDGFDYICIQQSGDFKLNIYATITTHDNKHIALQAGGTAHPTNSSGIFQVEELVDLVSYEENYQWLNGIDIRATGEADLNNGWVKLQAYY